LNPSPTMPSYALEEKGPRECENTPAGSEPAIPEDGRPAKPSPVPSGSDKNQKTLFDLYLMLEGKGSLTVDEATIELDATKDTIKRWFKALSPHEGIKIKKPLFGSQRITIEGGADRDQLRDKVRAQSIREEFESLRST
jgi:hypothetical protein